MSITVKNLIDKYSAIQESETVTASNSTTIDLNSDNKLFSEEETKVLAALGVGVVTEKVLKERRAARKTA